MIKRLLDVIISLVGFIAFFPLILMIAGAIWLTMGGPILFRQMRPGWRGIPFTVIKFRTMVEAMDASGTSLPDERRLTKLGGILRALSLDELPQLWNVLRGDMSLVGPRPLLLEYLPLYNDQQARRHEVRPGLTGWAQVNGRNDISWEEKFDMEGW